jgi:hypothetical protein
MKIITSLLAGGVLLIGLANDASALTETFSMVNPESSTLTDWTYGALFPQFNPALGTLQSVEIDLSATFTSTLTVENNAPTGSSGTVKTEVQFTLQDLGNDLTVPEVDLLSPNYAYSLGAGQGVTSGLLSTSGTSANIYTAGAILAEFKGGGNISLNASTFTQTLLANRGGNTGAGQVTNASLTGDVIYNYIQPVPEPATMALAGLGGLAMVLMRRRGK